MSAPIDLSFLQELSKDEQSLLLELSQLQLNEMLHSYEQLGCSYERTLELMRKTLVMTVTAHLILVNDSVEGPLEKRLETFINELTPVVQSYREEDKPLQ